MTKLVSELDLQHLLKKEEELLLTCKNVLKQYKIFMKNNGRNWNWRVENGLQEIEKIYYKKLTVKIIKTRLNDYGFSFYGKININQPKSYHVMINLESSDLQIYTYGFIPYPNGIKGNIIENIINRFDLETDDDIDNFINTISAKRLELF